jgi:DNA replication ATP-dependent helicase Dna2
MGHLTSSQAAFFKKWENLISLEERDLGKFRKELWCLDAQEREAKGRCFSNMIVDESYKHIDTSNKTGQRIHQFTYKFTRKAGSAKTTSLLHGFMSIGDAITLSVEPHLLALARGYILELTPSEVITGVDHEVSLMHLKTRLADLGHPGEDIVFRIDKDELSGGMSRIRNNLAQLFYAGGDAKRLRLIVDLEQPKFHEDVDMISSPGSLNPNQTLALQKALSAQDYALILGMPGTGKTTLIVQLIRRLVKDGKTVLITSYTHSAVDNILLKLTREDFVPLRVGNVDKVSATLRLRCLH